MTPCRNRSSSVAPAPVPPRSEAERRQLTVMFIDLVGSTQLSQRFDPEEMRDIIRAYQSTVSAEIIRYEGHVAKLMGDGVLAYFGWPRAHEDDAERAVRAGLAAMAATASLTTPRGEPLAARIGIATGLVVVGDLVGEGSAQEEARHRRDAQPGGTSAEPGRAEHRCGRRQYTAAGCRIVRHGRSRPTEAQGILDSGSRLAHYQRDGCRGPL